MRYEDYLTSRISKTPQSLPIKGREKEMVRNDAGGFVFTVDEISQLKRFLLIGSTQGTYYVSGFELTDRNYDNLKRLLQKDYKTTLDITAQYSREGRIVKNETALFVLAVALSDENLKVKEYASTKIKDIVRIPTHLFTLMGYLKSIRGFGRLVRRSIERWYNQNDQLVYHILKYQSRSGWTHSDVLRVVHPRPKDRFTERLFGWVLGKSAPPEHPLIEAFLKLRKASNEREVVRIVRDYKVPWEFVPSQWLGKASVWEALFPSLPMTALLRNLGRLTRLGVLSPLSENTEKAVKRLTSREAIRNARIHPLSLLVALKTYEQGGGMKGSLKWQPLGRIKDALERAIEISFETLEPTGKRFLIALDTSGSMTWESPIEAVNCMEAGVMMALSIVKAEERTHLISFDTRPYPLPIGKSSTYREAMRELSSLPYGGTDVAQPMLYALKEGIPVDVFMILTDNETWYGDIHPCQALERYRKETGIHSKLVVIAMTATNFSVADPQDPYQLDIAGFDTAVPKVVSEFSLL